MNEISPIDIDHVILNQSMERKERLFKHICETCGYSTNRLSNYKDHLSRKKPCKPKTEVSEYKDCPKCGVSKLKKCFSKDKSKKDGLQYKCKGCENAYKQENKLAIAGYLTGYRQENKAEIAEQRAGYYQENKVAIAEYNAVYRQEHKAEIAEQKAAYNAEPESKTKRNARDRSRRETDEGHRIETNLRSRLNKAMEGKKKSASTMKLVGLQSGTAIHGYQNLKSPWFKEQGVPSKKLETDHIIPCAEYKLEKPDHQKVCFHYTNLQYLTKLDNKKKSDKVPDGFNFESTLKKQLDLIARIEKDKLTYQQVLEMQKTGQLYEVKGFVI